MAKQKNKIDRINELQLMAARNREQMEAVCDEFLQLHGYERGTFEGDELESVIWDGADYEQCMKRIMDLKKERFGK